MFYFWLENVFSNKVGIHDDNILAKIIKKKKKGGGEDHFLFLFFASLY